MRARGGTSQFGGVWPSVTKQGIVARAGSGLDVLRWKLQGCLNVTDVGYEGAGERVRATSAGIVVESTIRRL